jgi:hypothetical protein
MQDVEKLVLAVFGGVITLAIISVIIGKNSKAPQAIQAISSGLANVVAAAANPVGTASTNGNPGQSTFASPQSFLGGIGSAVGSANQITGALGVGSLSDLMGG